MKIYENAMSNILIDLADESIKSIHFIDAIESDRPAIKAEILKTVKRKLKNKYNEELDADYIEAYIGDYIDDLASEIINGDNVQLKECDAFSTGVTGSTGLTNGIPNSGDGIGLTATPMGSKTTPKKKKKFRVVVKK